MQIADAPAVSDAAATMSAMAAAVVDCHSAQRNNLTVLESDQRFDVEHGAEQALRFADPAAQIQVPEYRRSESCEIGLAFSAAAIACSWTGSGRAGARMAISPGTCRVAAVDHFHLNVRVFIPPASPHRRADSYAALIFSSCVR
jgi:hypothetical protein